MSEETNPATEPTPEAAKAALLADLKQALSSQSLIKADEPMAKHTTLRVGGPADFYVEPVNETDLAKLLQFCKEKNVPWVVVGRGSNLLVRDGGIRGVVITLTSPIFSKIEAFGAKLYCGAGARLKNVANEARRQNLGGLEFLEGIPGSVGGALRMNAGAMGGTTFEMLEKVRYMDGNGQALEVPSVEIPVKYRNCAFFRDHIALKAIFRGDAMPGDIVAAKMKEYSSKRWTSQPAQPSAGCMFKNPDAIPAGKLVDELGLKGTRVGGALVSDVHGNFIVNDGNATARNVLTLIGFIKDKAKSDRGIHLETEVEIIGEDGPMKFD